MRNHELMHVEKQDSITLPKCIIDALDCLDCDESWRILKALISDEPFSYLREDEAYLYAILTLALGAVESNIEVRDA